MKPQLAIAASISFGMCMVALAPVQAETVHWTATLDGASEVPANPSLGKGTVSADLDTTSRNFTYVATYSGLTGPAVAAHFHGPAVAGANAPPVIMIKDLGSPIKGSAVLTPAQMTDLQAGKWYFNVHTKAHPTGEIRGQLSSR